MRRAFIFVVCTLQWVFVAFALASFALLLFSSTYHGEQEGGERSGGVLDSRDTGETGVGLCAGQKKKIREKYRKHNKAHFIKSFKEILKT